MQTAREQHVKFVTPQKSWNLGYTAQHGSMAQILVAHDSRDHLYLWKCKMRARYGMAQMLVANDSADMEMHKLRVKYSPLWQRQSRSLWGTQPTIAAWRIC